MLLAFLLVFSLFIYTPIAPKAKAVSDSAYDSLIFDPVEAYQGEYTIQVDSKDVVFKVYQVTYVTNPITGYSWGSWGPPVPSEDYFKMNISVPVSYDGNAFDENDTQNAPMLFYNPWGGDYGSAVGEAGSVGAMGQAALTEGWVVVEPGMRGSNCTAGTIGEDDYYNYGKLPYPLVDLKAAIRYLRYDNNSSLIPGNEDLIFAAGTSSGGDATVMLGSSGDSPLFDPYLEEMGAAPTSDVVFAAAPSCPVMTRQWADQAIAWERWGVISDDDTDADEINKLFANAFADYQDSLGLTAEIAVDGSIAVGDTLTSDNYADYLMDYVKQSAIRYLNNLGGREEIEAYLNTPEADVDMYGHPAATRDWLKPVYDTVDTDLVVDIDNTWQEFWSYVVGDQTADDEGTQMDTSVRFNMQYELPILAPDEAMEGNGVVNENAGTMAFGSPFANASSFSFGKPTDLAAAFSPTGQDYLMNIRTPAIAISAEYEALIELQRNFTDPLYFVMGDGAAGSTVCDNWFMRTGSIDLVTPHPVFFNLATALSNQGKNVDAALVWDQSHGLTTDLDSFFAFADQLIASETPDPSNPFTDVKTDDWFSEDVQYIFDNGLMDGVTATAFGPASLTSRAMVVTVLYRLEGEPAVTGTNSFTDLTADWYKDAVQWAVDNELTTGLTDTLFDPDASVTREQLAAFLYRYAAYKGYDTTQSADLSVYTDAAGISSYAYDAMAWSNAQGLINGESETILNPTGDSTRAVFASVLARFHRTFVG